MVFIVFFAILVLAGLGLFIAGHTQLDSQTSVNFRPWSAIPLGLAVLLLLVSSVTQVSPSQVGVPVTFGSAGPAFGHGLHVKAPWTSIHKISVKVQNYTMSSAEGEGNKTGDDSVPVHTKDQVTVNVDSTTLFRLTEGKAEDVYVNLGSDYVTQIVRPIIRSAIRDAATPYNAIDLATDKRAEFQAAVQTQVEIGLQKYGIELQGADGVQIRDIHLPDTIQNAVNAKAQAQQDVVRQSFVLQSKRAQAQQRIVDAQGLAQAQTIIHSTLTPEYLQYLYITTMQDLAKSKNTTFLFLPNNPSELPNFQLPLPGNTNVK